MVTMVERVARVMADSLKSEAGGNGYVDDESLRCAVLDGHFDLNVIARAAIEAMGEPTGEMTTAGRRSRNAQALFTADDAYHAWRAMIDAALAEK